MEFLAKFNRGGYDNNGEDGENFICLGEKTKLMEIFLNINKRGGSNNSGWGGKFSEKFVTLRSLIQGEAPITTGSMEKISFV